MPDSENVKQGPNAGGPAFIGAAALVGAMTRVGEPASVSSWLVLAVSAGLSLVVAAWLFPKDPSAGKPSGPIAAIAASFGFGFLIYAVLGRAPTLVFVGVFAAGGGALLGAALKIRATRAEAKDHT